MKFTCESCNAQYMISDEKVGPGGVKVRCKKCGRPIVVRRGADLAPAAEPAAPAAVAASGGAGLDAELGQAFDNAFGDPPPSAPAPDADASDREHVDGPETGNGADPGDGSPPSTEWYVAIGQAQVGPLPLAEVKKKWEAGDVGPDSLVWRPGMADWSALTSVPELAGYLAPVSRSRPQPARTPVPAPAPAPQQPAADVSWKPVGASALAALATEEIAARAPPEPKPAAARPVAAAPASLVDGLPDGGGVDPTGSLPLNLKALEATTGEKKIERRSSVARGAEQARRRSSARTLVTGVVIGVLLLGGAAAGGIYLFRQMDAPSAVNFLREFCYGFTIDCECR
jgi:predicted Zn finger-like uncharacterized protein